MALLISSFPVFILLFAVPSSMATTALTTISPKGGSSIAEFDRNRRVVGKFVTCHTSLENCLEACYMECFIADYCNDQPDMVACAPGLTQMVLLTLAFVVLVISCCGAICFFTPCCICAIIYRRRRQKRNLNRAQTELSPSAPPLLAKMNNGFAWHPIPFNLLSVDSNGNRMVSSTCGPLHAMYFQQKPDVVPVKTSSPMPIMVPIVEHYSALRTPSPPTEEMYSDPEKSAFKLYTPILIPVLPTVSVQPVVKPTKTKLTKAPSVKAAPKVVPRRISQPPPSGQDGRAAIGRPGQPPPAPPPSVESLHAEPVKRARGRPRKHPIIDPKGLNWTFFSNKPARVSTGRRPGRPVGAFKNKDKMVRKSGVEMILQQHCAEITKKLNG